MRKGNLTKEQAITLCGHFVVDLLDNKNADFTNRVQTDGDTDVEFSAQIETVAGVLIVYYYQPEEFIKNNDIQLCDLDWQVHAYDFILDL